MSEIILMIKRKDSEQKEKKIVLASGLETILYLLNYFFMSVLIAFWWRPLWNLPLLLCMIYFFYMYENGTVWYNFTNKNYKHREQEQVI